MSRQIINIWGNLLQTFGMIEIFGYSSPFSTCQWKCKIVSNKSGSAEKCCFMIWHYFTLWFGIMLLYDLDLLSKCSSQVQQYRPYAQNDHLSKKSGKWRSFSLYCTYSEIGGDIVQVEIKVDASCSETKVIILTDKMTEEVSELVKKISEQASSVLAGFRGDVVSVLDYGKIVRFYTANQKVYAVTESGEYTVRLRLYELEERLNPSEFVRISNTEIINLKKIQGFDLSFSGTICVKFQDGSMSYVSRRYVAKIKQVLGF